MGNICGKSSKEDDLSPPPNLRLNFTPTKPTDSRASISSRACGVGVAQPSYLPDPPDPRAAAGNAAIDRAAKANFAAPSLDPALSSATMQAVSSTPTQDSPRPLGKLGKELQRRKAQTWNMALEEYSKEQRERREVARGEAVLRYD